MLNKLLSIMDDSIHPSLLSFFQNWPHWSFVNAIIMFNEYVTSSSCESNCMCQTGVSDTKMVTVRKYEERIYCHGFNGGEGAGPKCRHRQEPGVNLKGLFNRNQNRSNAGEKLETSKKPKLYKNSERKPEAWKTREFTRKLRGSEKLFWF